MLIDVTNLVKGESLEVSFSQTMDIPHGVDTCSAEVTVTGSLTNNGSEFTFNGKVNAVLSLDCDLCLNTYKTEISSDMFEIYARNSDSDKEVWDFSDKTINLKPAVITNILLTMPMQAVCSDDCKGLCQVCGHNLNDGDCSCDKGYVNPTFEELLNLFNDKEV